MKNSDVVRWLIWKLGPLGFQDWACAAPLHGMSRWPTVTEGVWVITQEYHTMCPSCETNGRDEDCCSPYRCYQDWTAVHVMTPPVIPQENK